MINTINTWLIRGFCVFWALFLFIDYANNSGYLTQAFTYFEYTGLIITVFVFGGLGTYFFTKRRKPGFILEVNNFRNIYSYLFLLFFMGLIMFFYVNETEITKAKGGAVMLFLAKTIGLHLAILPILLAAFSSGSFIIGRSGITLSGPVNFFVSLATGFVIIVFTLFLLGAVGLIHQFVVLIVLVLLIIPGWKNIIPFIKNNLLNKIPAFQFHPAAIVLYGLILFLMALNLCYTTRPFPIGFDDLNLYMNIPKLIAGYGALTQGGDAYNWSLMMSLGFVIYKSATVSILLSVIPGMLSLIVLYVIARKLSVSKEWSLFACSLYYTLPNIIWQSRHDAKVDLALLFITLCSVLLLMEFYFSSKNKTQIVTPTQNRVSIEYIVWALCGVLVGFAFGIKYTSMLSIFAFLVFLFYITAGKWAAVGMFFMNFVVIFGLKLTRFAAFDADSILLTITPLVFAVIFFALAIKYHHALVFHSAKIAVVFCLFVGITFIPWAVKNIVENKSVSFEYLLTGKSPLPVLYPEMKGGIGYDNKTGPDFQNRKLEFSADQHEGISFAGLKLFNSFRKTGNLFADATSNEQPKQTERASERRDTKYTDKYEEIRRYLGYEKGFIRFLSLPYDLAMKTNVRLWSADTGILLLIILPLFVLVFSEKHFVVNLFKMAVLIFLLIAAILSVIMHSGPFELDKSLQLLQASAFSESEFFRGLLFPLYFAIKKILLMAGNMLMPLYKTLSFQTIGFSFMLVMFSSFLIYGFYKPVISVLNKNTKSLVAFTFCILICWMILSSGIFWYGMVGFALLMVVMALIVHLHAANQFIRIFIPACAALWFLLILPFQFMPIKFTLVKDMSQVDFKGFIDRPFGKYAIGAASEKEVYRQFFQPAEQNILNILNNDKKAGILNVSTFLTYHIVDNDKRVYIDNQLGIFDKVYQISNADKQEVLNEFKRKGIRYILVSLYTPTLDMTPEKSLTKKYQNMMNLLVNNPGAKLLFTNRVVERPDGNMPWTVDGKQVRAMYHLAGMRMLNQGSVAMFEIL